MVDLDLSLDPEPPRDFGLAGSEEREIEGGKHGRVRLKSLSRPKSYHQILEDFQLGGQSYPPSSHSTAALVDSTIEESSESEHDTRFSPPSAFNRFSQPPSPSPRRRKEDTARRSKRFSVPAIALHTTNVTARITASGPNESGNVNRAVEAIGNPDSANASRTGVNESGVVGRLRRLSLVTSGRNARTGSGGGGSVEDGVAARKLAETLAKADK